MAEQTDHPMTLPEAVIASAGRRPDAVAITLDQSQRTYSELVAGAERRARQMIALGIRPGERVGVLLPNCLDYFEIVIGAAMAGLVTVPMNTRFKARELRHLITDSQIAAIFTVHAIPDAVDFDALLGEALADTGDENGPFVPRHIIRIDDERNEAPVAEVELPPAPSAEDPLFLLYTSGTTANPKGCIVPHRALLSNAWAIIDRFELSAEDVWWCPLPMFHIGGLLFPTVMFAAGGTYAGMTHFNADAAIDMLARKAPTIFYPLFPTITLALTEHPRFATADFSGLRWLCNVAPEDVQRKIQAAVPEAPLFGAFGMTEACGTVCYGTPQDGEAERFSTCGKPLDGWEVKIVDPDSRAELPPGRRGEIAIRGTGLFQGYFGDEELTRRQFTADGFFLTGDVGSLDEDGFLSFHGRFKDQLKVGGENVSALEVESLLASHPAIHLAQVVGVADAKYGEVPAAFVELKPGGSLDEAEVIAFCRERIARFKVPRYVRFISEWPMSATKIVKYRLKERLDAELAQGS